MVAMVALASAATFGWAAWEMLPTSALPTHHPDPVDRQLIAQALVENIAIVTPDEAFTLYEGLKVVW